MRHKRTAVWMVALLSASLSLAACTVPTTTSGKLVASSNKSTSGQNASSNNPSSVFPNNQAPSTPTVPVSPTGPSLIANNSASSGGGGRLIANNTANLTGIVKIPAGLIANNSGSLIANNSGSIIANNSGSMFTGTGNNSYRVFSNASEQVAPGAIVTLRKADGTYVRDGNGNILTATTDSQGRYSFRYPVHNAENLLVHVYLVDGNQDPKGDVLGFVPMGGGGQTRTVDLNTTSSVVMSYILSSYVKQEQTILNRLTAPLELQTRDVIGAEPSITLPNLSPGAVLTAVNDARANVPVVETQMETVKRALLIGMPNQGQGQSILSVATDAFSSVATGAFGEVVFVGRGTKRVWMRSTTDTYEPVAGNGIVPITATAKQLPVTSPAPGDGGSATSASFWPTYLAFHKTGALYVADESYRRIRRVDENGIITTYAAFAEWDNMRGLAFEADGSLLVATYSAIYRVAPGGGANSVTLVAGAYRAPFTQTPTLAGGDTFIDIQGLAVDTSGGPNQGTIYVKDYNGTIRKIDALGAVTAVTLHSPLNPVPEVKLSNMGGIAVDRTGQLLVIDSFKSTMFKVNPALGLLMPAAGIGKAGVLGDGGPAGLARLGLPRCVHVDEVGNLFLSDMGLVRKIDGTSGNISTVAGMFRETPAAEQLKDVRMFYPTRLLSTPTGGILFADGFGIRNITVDPTNFNNSLVSLVSSDGIPNDGADTTFTGTGAAATANLMLVGPMTGDALGNLYYTAVNDESRQYLLRQDPAGNLTTLAGGNLTQWDGSALTPQAAVGAPLSAYHMYNDMLVLPTGDILYSMVSSANGSAIGASGALCLIKGGVMTPLFQAPTPISAMTLVTESGVPYMYMGVYGAIIKVNMAPWMAYMADPVNVPMPTISLNPLSPAGFTVVAGLPGTTGWADGGLGISRMGMPAAMVVRLESGVPQMYFSDPLELRVRKLNLATGIVSTVAGKNSPNLNQDTVDEGLLTPIGLAFDALGNLYIADNEHHQIKVLQAGSF